MSRIFLVFVGIALGSLGVALATGLSGFGALDPERLDGHRRLAQFCAILIVGVHSLVFVYMIGTGRAIKDAVTIFSIDVQLYEDHKVIKWRAAPWALSATCLTAATAVVGAFVGNGNAMDWIHPLLALFTLLVNLAGLPVEYQAIRENGTLLDEVARVTAEVNRDKIERGEDPAPPASLLTPFGWSLLLGVSAWLPWLYLRWIMNRPDAPWWPFAIACAFFVLPAPYRLLRYRSNASS